MASANLGLDFIPISKVTRKHFKQILIECKNVVTGWSPKRLNKYRAYLKILFGELIEYEATEIDPFVKIKRQKTIKRLRSILTQEERSLINKKKIKKKLR
jgi:site-specific recombinase XerD